jgi:heavy metal sensor kinase
MLLSIKSRIILFYLIVLFIVLSLLSLFLYNGLKKIVFDSIDMRLMSQAHSLEIIIDDYNDEIKNEEEFKSVLANKLLREYNFPESNDFFFQIRSFTSEGKTIKKSLSLENLDLPFSFCGNTNFETVFFNGQIIRKVDYYIPPQMEKGRMEEGVIVQCAEIIQKDIKILQEFKIILVLSIIFILISSTFGARFIAKKALLPVNEISTAMSRVSEANLSERIDMSHISVELKDIASSFNNTIELLEKSFIRQKEFIADASHELRTPLTTIMSQSEITMRKKRTEEEYIETLGAIMNASKIMSNIVQELLVLTRLSADRTGLNIKEIYIDEVINESIALLEPIAIQKGIKINVFMPDKYEIHGDRETLLDLFINIIDNSIKYNKPGGKVDISVKKDTSHVIIEIKDSGIGITEEDLHKVFNRFYRVDKSRSRESGGTGLGLSICKEIVNIHKGKIEIKSQISEGTTVEIYLNI